MKRFGYLEDEPSSSYTNNAIFNAVKEVQKFASIAQTGHIDNRTLSVISKKNVRLCFNN